MSLPAWVSRGAKCVCIIDEDWDNFLSIPSEGPWPKADEIFTIADYFERMGKGWLILGEQTVAPDFYAVDGFRPLTDAEQAELDARMFNGILKGASVEKLRAMELLR